MPIIDYQEVLKGLLVQEAMRRQVIRLPEQASLEQAICGTIKFKVNAILITDEKLAGLGVVSKTDLMGAYYSGLPLSTACGAVMMGPPLFCRAQDTLDQALTQCGPTGSTGSTSGRMMAGRPSASWLIRISSDFFTVTVIDASRA